MVRSSHHRRLPLLLVCPAGRLRRRRRAPHLRPRRASCRRPWRPIAAAAARSRSREPVGIQPFEADRIIVREPGGALSFLGGGQWADRLPRLIQTRIIQSLENSGRLRSVSRPGDKVVAEYQLISEIRAFDIQAGTGEAVVDLSLKLVADGTGKVAAARIFTARVPVAKIDAGNSARALDSALVGVLADVVRWGEYGALIASRSSRARADAAPRCDISGLAPGRVSVCMPTPLDPPCPTRRGGSPHRRAGVRPRRIALGGRP